jgi:hypothetical protein
MKLTTTLCAAAALLTACAATTPADPTKMTPEQLKALASDRSATASCSIVNSPWGRGTVTYVQLDRATVPAGEVSIGPDCVVTVRAEPAPARPARAASAP